MFKTKSRSQETDIRLKAHAPCSTRERMRMRPTTVATILATAISSPQLRSQHPGLRNKRITLHSWGGVFVCMCVFVCLCDLLTEMRGRPRDQCEINARSMRDRCEIDVRGPTTTVTTSSHALEPLAHANRLEPVQNSYCAWCHHCARAGNIAWSGEEWGGVGWGARRVQRHH